MVASGAAAQTQSVPDPAEAAAYRAVGRLDLPDGWFCAATLISAREALTAAHCLFDPATKARRPLGDLAVAIAGEPGAPATRRRVLRAATAPEFRLLDNPRPEELRTDIALLELEAGGDAPAPILPGGEIAGVARFSVVSRAEGLGETPVVIGACPRLAMMAEVLVLGCPIKPGMSGAPVLIGEGAALRVAAVVSGIRLRLDGAVFGLTVSAAPWIAELRRALAAEPG